MICVDLSNFDAAHDFPNPRWAEDMRAEGVTDAIVGSQWPDKARAQLKALRAAGVNLVATYAEPDVSSAIELALEFDCRYVGLACERGSITSTAELRAGVEAVKAAGLVPLIYGNAGDLASISNGEFGDELLWLANYGTNDPDSPREPIREVNFGGWTKVAIHQYSSTIVVAGRNRDHNYILNLEDDMTPEQVKALVTEVLGADFPEYVEAYFDGRFTERNGVVSELNPEGKGPIRPWLDDIAARVRHIPEVSQ